MTVAVPAGVVTTTAWTPAALAGTRTTTVVAFLDTIVPAVPPNVTDLVVARFVPVMVALIPPGVDPWVGVMPLTVGRSRNVNAAAFTVVPPVFVMDRLTAPAVTAGVVTMTVVAVLDTMVAAVVPNFTSVTSDMAFPVMVTRVPPRALPNRGATLLITTFAGATNV